MIWSVLLAGSCVVAPATLAPRAFAVGGGSALTKSCDPHQGSSVFADTESGDLYRIDPADGKTVWKTQLPEAPAQLNTLTVPACGNLGYVVTGSGYHGPAHLISFELATGKLGKPINVGLPGQVLILPGRREAYVANSGDLEGLEAPGGQSITPVDLVTGKALRPMRFPGQPAGLALYEHGSKAIVSLMNPGAVVTISTRNDHVGTPVRLPTASSGSNDGGPIVVDEAFGVALVGNLQQDLMFPSPVINVVDLKTLQPEQPISLNAKVASTSGLTVSDNDGYVYVASSEGVVPIAMRDRSVGSAVPGTGFPSALVEDPSGQTLYVGLGASGRSVASVPPSGRTTVPVTELDSPVLGLAVGH